MRLYILDHRHHIDSEYYDTKLIGIYSSYEIVLKTIEKYSQLPGFRDFKFDFHIEYINVRLTKKKMIKRFVYLLTNTKLLDDDEITVSYYIRLYKFTAIFSQMIKSIIFHNKGNQKFYVEKYCINKSNWAEGFVIVE